jgi:hypothetical protein
MADINDRSVVYNNAGIRLMNYGNYSAALEMFRGALETKLIQERTLLHNSTNAVDQEDGNMDNDEENQQRCVSPDGSEDSNTSNNTPIRSHQRNDNLDSFLDLLRNMDEQQMQNDQQSAAVSLSPDGLITSTNITTGSSIVSPSPSNGISNVVLSSYRGYDPYLYRIPFLLPGNDVTSSSQDASLEAQSISCRIVFNLGLIHQTLSRTSCKVASFYEIAATLLSSLPSEFTDSHDMAVTTVLLRIAILNNFGVWCYEKGEGESMTNSFEQLLDTLDEDQDLIDPSVVQGVRSNIQAFLTPNNGASLAA